LPGHAGYLKNKKDKRARGGRRNSGKKTNVGQEEEISRAKEPGSHFPEKKTINSEKWA